MRISFVIPTWKRPQHLDRCLKSIAEQIDDGGGDANIVIVDDCSERPTQAVIHDWIDRHSFISTRRRDEHRDYSDAFHSMFTAAPDADWVWTFGDDDLLRPGALKFMRDWLEKQPPELAFVHIAEQKRASGRNGVYKSATLLELCNQLGWIEMTGFITGNVTRSPILAAAAGTPHWRTYAKSAFVQSCILLERLREQPACFLDIPLITSQEMDQTEDSLQTWRDMNIPGRYMYVVDALECMYEHGILKGKLRPAFFRYLNAHLWDRYLAYFINDFMERGIVWIDEWSRVRRFAQFLDDPEEARGIEEDVEAASGITRLIHYLNANIEGLRANLADIKQRRDETIYPYSFVQPKEEAAVVPDGQ